VGGTTLPAGAYSVTPGKITFTPSASALLQSSGSKSIAIIATGYNSAAVTQSIGAGAATKLGVTTQPAAPASNGAVLATQPVVAVQDQYGNTVTTSTASINAAVGAGTWTIGGTTSVGASSGVATFSGLTATSAAAVANATITFTSGSLSSATSSTFNIPVPPPANDLSSAPTSVTVNGSAANGTTTSATYSTITSDSTTKNDVWFTFTAPEQGTVTLTTTSSTSQDLDIQGWIGPSTPASITEQKIADGADVGNTTEVATLPVTAGTLYFVRVLQYGGTAGSFTITATMPTSPSTPASNFTSSNLTSASATIGWTRGNGDAGVLVVARAGGAVNADPTNGTTYTANAAFGSGTQIGTGNYVVYRGTGTSVSVTGLSPSTAYYFAVYEYNATGLMHNMAELTGNLSTSSGVVAPSVTTSAATAIGSTIATLNGNPTADNGNAITGRGFVYSSTDATPTIGEAGVTQVSLSGTTGAMSTALTSLGANTTYYVNAYAINGIGTSYGTVQSFTTSQLSAPITSAGDSITSSGFNANWSAVTGATGYQLDVYIFTAPTTTDLIISEYVEGSSNNKYVEIYNGTGSTVTLSNYELRLHANGAAIGSPTATQNLGALTSGPTTLANGQTLVLKNSGAALALPAGVTAYDSTAVNFNGDDALALYKISTSSYVDIFGVLGSRPTNDWGTGVTSCIDRTQKRKLTVTGGVTVNPGTFSTLGTEWDSYAIDTVSDLGSHKSTSYLLQNQSVGNLTTYAVTGASATTQYSYVVRATSANSTSANSDVRTVTTKGASSISVNSGTTGLTYSGSAQRPTFTVTGSTGAVTYSYTGTGGTSYGPSSTAPTNVGSYSVTATAAADTNFDGVPSSATASTIAEATPIISVAPTASAITYGQTLASSSLTGGTPSTPGTFAFTTPSTAPNAGTASQNVTFTPNDTVNYNTASTTASVVVNKAAQTITNLAATDSKTYGGIYMDFDLSATKGASTSALSYSSSNTSVATIHPTTGSVHIVGAGTTTLTVNQAADANYNAAPAVTQILTVSKADHAITFGSLAAVTYSVGATFNLAAYASSGLTVSYASSDTTVATVSGSAVTILKAGSTIITASQAGNGNYNAATAVTRTLTVNPAAPSSLSYVNINGTVGTAITNVNPTVTGTVDSYSISPALPQGLSLNTVTGVISGTPLVTAASAIYTVTATNAGGNTSATLTVAVLPVAPSDLSYANISGTVGAAITNVNPTVTGTVDSYSISPALPAGLLLNTGTGVISGTPSAAAASAIYTVTATNAGGSTSTALTIVVGYAVGPVAVADSLTKPAGNAAYLIPVSQLLANDYRITNSSGATVTTGLSVSAVTSGSGNTATLAGVYIQFTPSSAPTDTFTYTVSYGGMTATGTVTITTETQAPSFDLQIVKLGTATFSVARNETTVRHDFIGVPKQNYLVEYSTDLTIWTPVQGSQYTGDNGSFSVDFAKSEEVAADWNAHMFFRARLAP